MTRWDWDLSSTSGAPGIARGHVRDALEGCDAPRTLVDDAVLLVSELVSNAVEHGHGAVSVSMRDVPGGWHLRVHDDGSAEPLMRGGDLSSEGGRGLVLVDTLAHDWGTDQIPADGKDVWFTLTTNP